MTYQDALDLLFSSFLSVKHQVSGCFDRDVRNPTLLLGVAEQMGILPARDKVIKVTGSKGKGTVARLAAQYLQTACPDLKIALVISPEEIDHTDRMSLNGQTISRDEFADSFNVVWQASADLRDGLKGREYLSPYGLFLLTALVWFDRQNVDYVVVECGRGAKFDEGGRLGGAVGVVTSVFQEHETYLGPDLSHIAADKLSISETSDTTLAAQQVAPFVDGMGIELIADPDRTVDLPYWMGVCDHLARHSVQRLLGREVVPLARMRSASFGMGRDGICYEGAINPHSLDESFMRARIDQGARFIVSLPDDKDVDGVCDLLRAWGGAIVHMPLRGERGVLSYERCRARNGEPVICDVIYNDVTALRQVFSPRPNDYFIGTQTFLRLIKQAFDVWV